MLGSPTVYVQLVLPVADTRTVVSDPATQDEPFQYVSLLARCIDRSTWLTPERLSTAVPAIVPSQLGLSTIELDPSLTGKVITLVGAVLSTVICQTSDQSEQLSKASHVFTCHQ